MQPTVYHAFVYGLMGSFAVEMVLLYQAIGPKGGYPGKYKHKFFWVVRSALAFSSGIIATAYYHPELSFVFYVHIGAATPAIVTVMSKGGDLAGRENAT